MYVLCEDESGSDSEGADSASSSYSSLSDLIAEMPASEIDSEIPCEFVPVAFYFCLLAPPFSFCITHYFW